MNLLCDRTMTLYRFKVQSRFNVKKNLLTYPTITLYGMRHNHLIVSVPFCFIMR